VVCGLTLYHRPENPLRFDPRALFRITLPEAAAEDETRWHVDVDLGTVGRTFALPNSTPRRGCRRPPPGWANGPRSAPAPAIFTRRLLPTRVNVDSA